jgi:hypothetical protein
LAPGPGLRANQVGAAARSAVGRGPGASEAELRAAQAVRAELLGLLDLPAGAPAGEVRTALKKKDGDGNLLIHRALIDEATGPELVRAMLDVGGEAMLGVPTGYENWLPLHRAASNSPSPAVVALLLARGPAGSARAKSGSARPPLDYAERSNRRAAGAEEIKALLRAAMQ